MSDRRPQLPLFDSGNPDLGRQITEMFGSSPTPSPTPSKAKVEFMEGVLAAWFETIKHRPPNRAERVTLKAGAEQVVVAYQAALLLGGEGS